MFNCPAVLLTDQINKMATSWNSRGSNDKKVPSAEDILESENNRMVDSLASKVSRLRGIAIDIEQESKQQNSYLDGMSDDFGSTSGLLGGSAQRLSKMVAAGRSNKKMMCYLIIGLVFTFFVAYYALARIVK